MHDQINQTLYLTPTQAMIVEGNYDDLKLRLEALNKEMEHIDLKELEKNLVKEKLPEKKKEKLSNNAIQKLQEEMLDIELSLDVIDEKFNDPNTKYDEFADLNEEKSNLETRYYEILGILEENDK